MMEGVMDWAQKPNGNWSADYYTIYRRTNEFGEKDDNCWSWMHYPNVGPQVFSSLEFRDWEEAAENVEEMIEEKNDE